MSSVIVEENENCGLAFDMVWGREYYGRLLGEGEGTN